MKGLIILLAVVAYASAKYCNLESCRGKPHTLCAYSPQNKCKSPISRGLTKNEKDQIVRLHNELRQKVARGEESNGTPGPQPPTLSKSMANLVWNDEIAKIAQHWADQCQFDHDECRNTPEEYVGQNIAYQGTTGNINELSVEKMVQKWYDEVQHFDGRSLTGIPGKVVGHYTQLVWSETNKIGCGAVKYNERGYKKFYLVCNYAPGGNIDGAPVYKTKHIQSQNQQHRPQPQQPSYNNWPTRRPQTQSHPKTSYSYTVNGKPATKEEYENFQNQYSSYTLNGEPVTKEEYESFQNQYPSKNQGSWYTWNGKSVTKEEYDRKYQEYQNYLSGQQYSRNSFSY